MTRDSHTKQQGFTQHKFANLGNLLLHQVEDSSGSGDNEVNVLQEPHDVVLEVGAAGRDHDPDAQVLGKLDGDLRGLKRQLASWNDDHA